MPVGPQRGPVVGPGGQPDPGSNPIYFVGALVMQVIDEPLLEEFRWGPCDWCGETGRCDPHHLWGRGMGGGSRLDIEINLVSLCRFCHRSHHDGNEPTRADLLAIVAAREDTTQDAIIAQIAHLRREPK